MTHSYVWHDSFMCVPWLVHTCDMMHSLSSWRTTFLSWAAVFARDSWHMYEYKWIRVMSNEYESWHMYECKWIRVMSHVQMSQVTHVTELWHMYECKWIRVMSHVQMSHLQRRLPFARVTWLVFICIHTCAIIRSHVWLDTFVRVGMPHDVWHDPFICVTCHTHEWGIPHTKMIYSLLFLIFQFFFPLPPFFWNRHHAGP